MRGRGDEMKDLLRTFTYKPGWQFECSTGSGPAYMLIVVSCTNTYPPHDRTQVGLSKIVPPQGDLQEWLLEQIVELEAHEVREWFKVGGQLPYNPHALATTDAVAVRVQWPHGRWPL
jgi:hypothetical protein